MGSSKAEKFNHRGTETQRMQLDWFNSRNAMGMFFDD